MCSSDLIGKIGGSTGDIAGGNIDKSSGGGGKGVRWLIIAVVAVVLVAGLAWGTNGFSFSWLGIQAESVINLRGGK